MTAVLVTALALAAVPQAAPPETGHSAASPQELRDGIRTALAAEAKATGLDERLSAVAEIVRLYGDLKSSSQMAYRDRLRLRAKLRSRLGRVAADLERELPQPDAAGQSGARPVAAGADGGQAVDDPAAKLIDLIESTIRPDAWRVRGGAGVMAARGGPAAAGAGAAGGGGGFGGGIHGGGLERRRAEQAEHLIDLIQQTIRPESWEVNGGRGTIMYWPGS